MAWPALPPVRRTRAPEVQELQPTRARSGQKAGLRGSQIASLTRPSPPPLTADINEHHTVQPGIVARQLGAHTFAGYRAAGRLRGRKNWPEIAGGFRFGNLWRSRQSIAIGVREALAREHR
jgi:hypothetical protein